jgi:hypothetical protein
MRLQVSNMRFAADVYKPFSGWGKFFGKAGALGLHNFPP